VQISFPWSFFFI